MKATLRRYVKSQSGFTLVEVIVASAIGLIVMTGLTSVVLTSWRAWVTATSRVEASSAIRNFQFQGNDDFALSSLPVPPGCGTSASSQCSTQAITLQGSQFDKSGAVTAYQVTYTWDKPGGLLMRQIGANPAREAATNVSAFSWYVDGSTQAVVATISVTVQSYTQTQTLRFYTHVNP
jgi:prepilin-type N-terminal cleavage/methylation domain-containing protein